MLDPLVRRVIDPPLARTGALLAGRGVEANAVSWVGFACGVAAALAIAFEAYIFALVLFAFNRLADGLDGAVARRAGKTDLGGFLDIVLDFLVYGLIVLGFALADPAENAIVAAILLMTFIGTGSTFLAFAIFAERRGLESDMRGEKSLYYLGGLTEGTETAVAFAIFMLWPDYFVITGSVFAVLCAVTAVSRIAVALQKLRD